VSRHPKVIARFLREIRAAGRLSHPNIVHAYDADQVNGAYYIVMEYIDGVDLAKLVKDNGRSPLNKRAISFVKRPSVCSTLTSAARPPRHQARQFASGEW